MEKARPASLALCLSIYFLGTYSPFKEVKIFALHPELFDESGKKLVELGGLVIALEATFPLKGGL